MNKLEETKKSLEIREELGRRDSDTLTIRYLLSLIEEKDKALAFYADEATYDVEHLDKHGYIIIDKDSGDIARKALRGE